MAPRAVAEHDAPLARSNNPHGPTRAAAGYQQKEEEDLLVHQPHLDHCGDFVSWEPQWCCPQHPQHRRCGSKRPRRSSPHNSSAALLPPGVLDPYQVLAVRRDATPAELKRAYARLALLYHPSRQPQNHTTTPAHVPWTIRQSHPTNRPQHHHESGSKTKNAPAMVSPFAAIAAAYETLTDAVVRRRMDDLLYHPSSIRSSSAGVGSVPSLTSTTSERANPTSRTIPSVITPNAWSPKHNEPLSDAEDDEMTEFSTDQIYRQRSNIVYSPVSTGGVSSMGHSFADDPRDAEADPTLLDCDWRGRNEKLMEDDRSSRVSLPSNHSSRFQGSALARGARHKKKNSKKYNLANDSSSHSSSSHTPPPPLLQASSSSDDTTGEDVRHYSVAATERLFGGPLQFMYRARRWQPFTDPHTVFQHVFHSALPPATSRRDTTTTPVRHLESVTPATLRSETETLPNGTVVHRNTKCWHRHRTLVRTVTRYPDPRTGVTRTRIQVVTTHDPPPPQHGSMATSSAWRVCLGIHEQMLWEECGGRQHTQYEHEEDPQSPRHATTKDENEDEPWACRAWLPVCL